MDQSEERGRPIDHMEPWARITLVLLDRHVAFLDRLAIDIRLRYGKVISQPEVIRGLIEAALANTDRESLEKFVAQFAGTLRESG